MLFFLESLQSISASLPLPMRSRKVFRKTESKEKGTVKHCLELNMRGEACVDEFLKILCLLSKINLLRTQANQKLESSYFVSATSAMNKK